MVSPEKRAVWTEAALDKALSGGGVAVSARWEVDSRLDVTLISPVEEIQRGALNKESQRDLRRNTKIFFNLMML